MKWVISLHSPILLLVYGDEMREYNSQNAVAGICDKLPFEQMESFIAGATRGTKTAWKLVLIYSNNNKDSFWIYNESYNHQNTSELVSNNREMIFSIQSTGYSKPCLISRKRIRKDVKRIEGSEWLRFWWMEFFHVFTMVGRLANWGVEYKIS